MLPVFIEFTSRHSDRPPTHHYFVGANFKTILQDTNNGLKFGQHVSFKIMPEEQMRQLEVMAIDRAIELVRVSKGSVCLHKKSSHVVIRGTPNSLRNVALKLLG